MRVLALASQKGGSGKTTLSGHLAVQAQLAGAGPVVLIDIDPQGSLADWWNERETELPAFAQTTVARLAGDLEMLRQQGFKLAVIDTPPAITMAIQSVIAVAELIVIPTRPSPHDLRAVGATVDLCERAGKPLLFARLREGPLYFGLPGNPVSAAVGLRFFVEAALRMQLGLPEERAWRLPLAHEVRKKAGVRLQQKSRLQLSNEGRWSVALLRGQESFRTQPLLAANAWASLPETAESLPSGASVEVYALGHEMNLLLGEQSE